MQNKKSKTVKASSVQKDKIYQCDNCENSYSSVSGLRGHLQKKHGITNVKGLIYFLSALFSQRHSIYNARKSRTWRLKLYNRALQSLLVRKHTINFKSAKTKTLINLRGSAFNY